VRKYALVLLLLFSVSLYAEPLDTSSYIDQALEQLRIIEENNIALKALLTEREATIIESEKSLKAMTAQFKNLETSYSLLKNVSKCQWWMIAGISAIAIAEGIIIAVR